MQRLQPLHMSDLTALKLSKLVCVNQIWRLRADLSDLPRWTQTHRGKCRLWQATCRLMGKPLAFVWRHLRNRHFSRTCRLLKFPSERWHSWPSFTRGRTAVRNSSGHLSPLSEFDRYPSGNVDFFPHQNQLYDEEKRLTYRRHLYRENLGPSRIIQTKGWCISLR